MTKAHPMTGGAPLRRFRVAAAGAPPRRTRPVLWPVRTGGSTGKVGSFGMTRSSGAKMHNGVDWLADKPGVPVFAAHDGVVRRAGEQSGGKGFGQRIYLTLYGPDGPDDGDDRDFIVETIYAHLAVQFVTVGQKIRAGHQLGTLGRSGNIGLDLNDIPTHLHFEARVGIERTPVDPEAWLYVYSG